MIDSKYAPVVLFCYNRLAHTRKTIEALKENTLALETDLIIYSDAPKNELALAEVTELRTYLKTISGFKSVQIIERDHNYGLAASIIEGVSRVTQDYGRAIILEDDLVTHLSFLSFMNEGLTKFQNDERVISIHGFVFPIPGLPETFFLRGADCWGWATWTRGWKLFNPDGKALLKEIQDRKLANAFDFDGHYPYVKMLEDQISGKNSSWAIRWYASAFLRDKLTLYPGRSLVRNIGYDSGTHFSGDAGGNYFGVLSTSDLQVGNLEVLHSDTSYHVYSEWFRARKLSLFKRIQNKILKIIRTA